MKYAQDERVDTVATWRGAFGHEYTDRNTIDWRRLVPAFGTMIGGLGLERVVEVGCNRGHNLQAVAEILGEAATVIGVEPNRYAITLARQADSRITAVPGTAMDLPFRDGYADLVFTVGVLIHVPPVVLPAAFDELHRVSRRFLLMVEYFAEKETPVRYRDRDDLLWKRDFAAALTGRHPALQLHRHGYWGPEDGFDRTHWWLFEKPMVADSA